jgi:hypothetical protein
MLTRSAINVTQQHALMTSRHAIGWQPAEASGYSMKLYLIPAHSISEKPFFAATNIFQKK